VSEVELVNVYDVQDSPVLLYRLLQERSTEDDPYINISHRKLPTWREHLKFFDSKPYRRWYLIQTLGERYAGTCYLTRQNEIGIVLFREHRGNGYGLHAVNKLITEHKPLKAIPGKRSGQFIANINPNNQRSIRIFQRLGFTHIQNTYEL